MAVNKKTIMRKIILFITLIFPIHSFGQTAEDFLYKGQEKHINNDFKGAISDFNKSIKLNPKIAAVYFFRGYSYLELKNYDKASYDFNKTIELDPLITDAYYFRGKIKFILENYEAAIMDYNTVIIQDSKYSDAYYGRAVSYLILGNYNKACVDFNEAKLLGDKKANKMIEKYCQ